MTSPLRRSLALGLGVLVLCGCGRQVAVTPPEVTDGTNAGIPQACQRVEPELPDTVDGAGRRPTTPDSPATAAWGDPAITWRCGVPRPSALTATSVLIEVGGISWLPEELTAGTLFTAVEWPDGERPVYAEVAIPDAYAAPGGILADLAPALQRAAAGVESTTP